MKDSRKRILLAEDNKIFARTLCFNLESAGFHAVTIGDGKQALVLAQQGHFDLVIADYQMPGMVGIELCRNLRQFERYAQTPMILISGFEDLKIVELFDDLHLLEAVFVKPFRVEDLVAKIHECLGAVPASAIGTTA